jgi:predicted XRE-type DNA-binding protein
VPQVSMKKAQVVHEKIEITESCGNVFADLGFPPDEAANLSLRSTFIAQLMKIIQDQALTKAQAAKQFGVTQPQITLLLKGKIQEFSIDELVNMFARAGYEIEPKFVTLRRIAPT